VVSVLVPVQEAVAVLVPGAVMDQVVVVALDQVTVVVQAPAILFTVFMQAVPVFRALQAA
jgi:antitoxin component of MazEF toxin-antitoxin module